MKKMQGIVTLMEEVQAAASNRQTLLKEPNDAHATDEPKDAYAIDIYI